LLSSSSCFKCGIRREIWHFLVFVLLFFVYFVLFLHPFKLLLLELTFPTTTVMGNTSEAERDNSVPLGYIIICSRRMPHLKQELLTLSEHVSSPSVFSGVRLVRSLVSVQCHVDPLFVLFIWPLYWLSYFDLRINDNC
jgi:hypothetical protein